MLDIQISTWSALAVSVGIPTIQYSFFCPRKDYFCVLPNTVAFIL